LALLMLAGAAGSGWSQEFWGAGNTFSTVRSVRLSGMALPRVVVVEFLAHGELNADGSNLAVYDAINHLVPWRVLQVGPGDFCRIAIATSPKMSSYRILYGGKTPSEKPPSWKETAGLLLQTRRWKRCDLAKAASVRDAFQAAEPLGGDYVDGVFHRFNPFRPDPGSFLSRYEGVLTVTKEGTYAFFTSSQDCSFLFIDGKEVVAAPGVHGPVGDARIRGEVRLSPGKHTFEYLHAAAGPDACMVAAWEPPAAARPEVIPANAFGSDDVAHVRPGPPQHRTRGSLPDLAVLILGDVGLAETDLPIVRVQFVEGPSHGDAMKRRCHWDFGDGQSADETDPVHIYLHPGMFRVKVTPPTGSPLTQQVHIHRAVAQPDSRKGPDRLADYLPLLNRYDPTKLPPLAALQLVRLCDEVGQPDRAVKVGRTRLLEGASVEDEEVVQALVRLIGPRLRDHQEDSAGAAAVWEAAARAIARPQWKAECELQAADIRLHDLHQREASVKLVEAAARRLDRHPEGALAGRLHRLWGDCHARAGDRDAARAAYGRAAEASSQGSMVEQAARRGAFSRSTEAFLRGKEFDRARDELRRWEEAFPQDRANGYLPLLWARYHAGRGKYAHAIVAANDLLAVNRDASTADAIVFLAAECQEKVGHGDRARAGYRSLLSDYPGSPLVPAARQKLAVLQEGRP
jgi:TolA-binding protein